MIEVFDPMLAFVVGYTGSFTVGLLKLSIVSALVSIYVVVTIKNLKTSISKIIFWISFSVVILGIILNALMEDYDRRNMKTIVTCTNTRNYPPMSFDHNVSIYHVSEVSRYGYGRYKQSVEIWTDNGERCDFMNGVINNIE